VAAADRTDVRICKRAAGRLSTASGAWAGREDIGPTVDAPRRFCIVPEPATMEPLLHLGFVLTVLPERFGGSPSTPAGVQTSTA
jgi:hypothetical protein